MRRRKKRKRGWGNGQARFAALPAVLRMNEQQKTQIPCGNDKKKCKGRYTSSVKLLYALIEGVSEYGFSMGRKIDILVPWETASVLL